MADFVATIQVAPGQRLWRAEGVPHLTADALYRYEPEPNPMTAQTELRRFTSADLQKRTAGRQVDARELAQFARKCRAAGLPKQPEELMFSRWGEYLEVFNHEAKSRGWWAGLIPPRDPKCRQVKTLAHFEAKTNAPCCPLWVWLRCTVRAHPVRLEHVPLASDDEGEPVTSCVVRRDESPENATRSRLPKGGNQKVVLDALGDLLRNSADRGQAGAPQQRPCVETEAAANTIGPRLMREPLRRKERTRESLTWLVGDGLATWWLHDKTATRSVADCCRRRPHLIGRPCWT